MVAFVVLDLVIERSHCFTYYPHPTRYQYVKCAIPAFTPQLHSITIHHPVLVLLAMSLYNQQSISRCWYRLVINPICRSVSPENVLLQNGWLDLDGEWGQSRDGCIRWGGDLRRERGSFGGKCGHPIVTIRECGIVILCCEGLQHGSSQITLGFLVSVCRYLLFCLFNRPTNIYICQTVVWRIHLNVYNVIQECRTWLNVASNQELNKASYEAVQQSYTAALECARQACDAKLEVHYTILTCITCAFCMWLCHVKK